MFKLFNGSTSSTFTTTCSKDSKDADADADSKVADADADSKVADADSKDSGSKVSKCFGCNVSTFTSLAAEAAPSLTLTTVVTHS